jgi:hypothetical protein
MCDLASSQRAIRDSGATALWAIAGLTCVSGAAGWRRPARCCGWAWYNTFR